MTLRLTNLVTQRRSLLVFICSMPPPASHSLLDPLGTAPSLVLLQYDLAVSCAPVLRQVVQDMIARWVNFILVRVEIDELGSQTQVIFVSTFMPMSRTIGDIESSLVHEVDLSGNVPGYTDERPQPDILSLISDKISSGESSNPKL